MKMRSLAARLFTLAYLVLLHTGFVAATDPMEEMFRTFLALSDLSSAVSESRGGALPMFIRVLSSLIYLPLHSYR